MHLVHGVMSNASSSSSISSSARITELENRIKSLEGVISALRFSNEQLRKHNARECEVAELRAELKDTRVLQEKDRLRLIRLLRIVDKFRLPLPPDDVPVEEYAGEEYARILVNAVQDRIDPFVARAAVAQELKENKLFQDHIRVLFGASCIRLTNDDQIQIKLLNPRKDRAIAFSLRFGAKFMDYQPDILPEGAPELIKERFSFLKDEAPLFFQRILRYIFDET